MILSDTDQYIKDSLDFIISGGWNGQFSPGEVNGLLRLSFILNNLEYLNDYFEFSYGGIKISLTGYSIDGVISGIRSSIFFEKVFNQFLRDKKIESILCYPYLIG